MLQGVAQSLDVVVPSASSPDVVDRTLRALLRAARHVPSLRVVIIVGDDRPERGIDALLDQSGARRVVTSGRGAAAARNAAAAAGSAGWLLFIDDDVELDAEALVVVPELRGTGPDAVVGALRAPGSADVPAWLRRSYFDGTIAPSAASVQGATSDGTLLTSALLLIRRSLFEEVGGFPELGTWGWEDPLFGIRAQRAAARADWLALDPRLAGVHHYVPSWVGWLDRQRTAGRRLRDLLRVIEEQEQSQLLRAVGLEAGPKANLKRTLGAMPMPVWSLARGAVLRHLATSAAFARGFREASRAG